MGTDFFTFKLQLGSLSSILATIAITVDDDLTKAKNIAGQRKLGANVLQAKRASLLDTFRNSRIPGSLVVSSSEVSASTLNPMTAKREGKSKSTAVEMSQRDKGGRSLAKSLELNESFNL